MKKDAQAVYAVAGIRQDGIFQAEDRPEWGIDIGRTLGFRLRPIKKMGFFSRASSTRAA